MCSLAPPPLPFPAIRGADANKKSYRCRFRAHGAGRSVNGRIIITYKTVKIDCMKEHCRMSIAYQQGQGGGGSTKGSGHTDTAGGAK